MVNECSRHLCSLEHGLDRWRHQRTSGSRDELGCSLLFGKRGLNSPRRFDLVESEGPLGSSETTVWGDTQGPSRTLLKCLSGNGLGIPDSISRSFALWCVG